MHEHDTRDRDPAKVGTWYVIETEQGDKQLITEEEYVRGEYDGAEKELTTTEVSVASDGTKTAVLVSADGQLGNRDLPSDATATIWTGTYDDSGTVPSGVANETIDVTVTKGGSEETFTVDTDSNGSASVSYDLSESGRGSGTYSVEVSPQSHDNLSATTQFNAGVRVKSTAGFRNTILTGKESTFSFLAHDGDSGVSGEDLDLTITKQSDGSQVKQVTKTTDSAGFATVSFTPSSRDTYNIQAVRNNSLVASAQTDAWPAICWNDFDFRNALRGATNTYGGYIITANGRLSNTDVTITFYTDATRETQFAQKTTTTDSGGFFTVDYTVPPDFSGGTLYPEAETTNIQSISLQQGRIGVTDVSSADVGDGGGGGEQDPVELTATADSRRAPGETLTVDVSATDGDSPITGQDVDLYLSYGTNGPPLYSTTLTTDTSGEATAAVQLPDDTADNSNVRGTLGMEYNGNTYTASTFTSIRAYQIDFDTDEFRVARGESATLTLDVTDEATDQGAAGIPVQFDAQYLFAQDGSFDTGRLESGSDGTDTQSVTIPNDIGHWALFNRIDRYNGTNVGRQLTFVGSFGNLQLTDDTLVAGESANFEFDIQNDATLYGIVFGETPRRAERPFGKVFQGTSFSLQIPPQFTTGENFFINVYAIDDQGRLYSGSEFTSIDQDASQAPSVTAQGGSAAVGGEVTISVDASDAANVIIEKLWTDWTIAGQSTGSANVEDAISETGQVGISYGATLDSISPSLTISLPDRYIGGEYEVDVIALSGNGKTAETTATITIS
ncbi:hypothetical protein BRD19_09995 [Halobacteriales archaeon SW_7_65_23]|nr:MAG: hypothetical protein BRD19_09995 [Halobacteriales archaeon SW_7_65_23]